MGGCRTILVVLAGVAAGCAIKVNTTVSAVCPLHGPIGPLLHAPALPAETAAGPGPTYARPVVVEELRQAYDQPIGLWIRGFSGGSLTEAPVEMLLVSARHQGSPRSDSMAPESALARQLAEGIGPSAEVRRADDFSLRPPGSLTLRGWIDDLVVYRLDDTWVARIAVRIVVLDGNGEERCRRRIALAGRIDPGTGAPSGNVQTILGPIEQAESREILCDPALRAALELPAACGEMPRSVAPGQGGDRS